MGSPIKDFPFLLLGYFKQTVDQLKQLLIIRDLNKYYDTALDVIHMDLRIDATLLSHIICNANRWICVFYIVSFNLPVIIDSTHCNAYNVDSF